MALELSGLTLADRICSVSSCFLYEGSHSCSSAKLLFTKFMNRLVMPFLIHFCQPTPRDHGFGAWNTLVDCPSAKTILASIVRAFIEETGSITFTYTAFTHVDGVEPKLMALLSSRATTSLGMAQPLGGPGNFRSCMSDVADYPNFSTLPHLLRHVARPTNPSRCVSVFDQYLWIAT